MRGKGRVMWNEVRWRRDLERVTMLNRILGGEVPDKTESAGNWRKSRRLRKYGNVERYTVKTTIVGGKIGRRAKAHKEWGTLSHTEAVCKIPAQRCSPTRHVEPVPLRGKVFKNCMHAENSAVERFI